MKPCPICTSRESDLLYGATDQPATLNALYPTREAALAAPRAELEFRTCRVCSFVSNHRFDAGAVTYDATYVNDQSHSPVFRSHLDSIVNRLVEHAPNNTQRMLEIGCGQGGFLRALQARIGGFAVGIDPACAGQSHHEHVRLIAQPFDEHAAEQLLSESGRFDLIICRHVFEHVPDPMSMLSMIRRVLHPTRGVLYVEVPDLTWIVEHGTFFDFFHEHCSLFSSSSLTCALRRAGFESRTVESTFSGQYLSAFAGPSASNETMNDSATPTLHDVPVHARALRSARDTLSRQLQTIREHGTVILWGAGAKAVSLLAHLDLDEDVIPFIVDINPTKQRRFVAVTGREIIAPAELSARLARSTPASIVVMNSNYADEISAELERLEIDAECHVLDNRIRHVVHA